LKKKTKKPRGSLAQNLVGEKLSRRMNDEQIDELIDAVTVKKDFVRKLN
jgi:hypothetical protein